MKKTREEYEAAALLLGMNYDANINTFYAKGVFPPQEIYEYDADTMEPLSREAVAARQVEHIRTRDIVSVDDFVTTGGNQ